jgi:hypothetical protein
MQQKPEAADMAAAAPAVESEPQATAYVIAPPMVLFSQRVNDMRSSILHILGSLIVLVVF